MGQRQSAVEELGLSMSAFWAGKKVLLTGHTGFKGAWLVMLLHRWGAKIYGYALPAETPSLHNALGLSDCLADERLADICDSDALADFYKKTAPDITLHMAAQALVLPSYQDPVETFRVNALGTAALLDVVRRASKAQTVIAVTTDKVYENLESGHSYNEADRLGAGDPYSASKACAELVAASFRHSFCHDPHNNIRIKTARAGNVIGAGDWSAHRLIPDAARAALSGASLEIRHPESVRPWQHVLEPLSGYLRLAEKTATAPAAVTKDSFNFGPARDSCEPTGAIIAKAAALWDGKVRWHSRAADQPQPPEANLLHLDSTQAQDILDWRPRWNIDQALAATVAGYQALAAQTPERARAVLTAQIEDYFS